MLRSIYVLTVVGIWLAALLGCGRDDGRVRVYPVSGQVLLRGEPIEGAKVLFYPESDDLIGGGKPLPKGFTDANGEFHLRSYSPNDGAPADDFMVTVQWFEPTPPNVDEDDERYQPKDRLGGRYHDPKTSGLTATVKRGGGALTPFELE